jgi:hypothetical protein
MMSLSEQLNRLILHPSISEYIDLAYSVPRESDDPFLSYFGFNYREGKILNFKVYFEFHNLIEEKFIAKLLPETSLFLRHYPKDRLGKVHDENHTGVTFALKIDSDFNLTRYFHFLKNGKAVQLPLRLELTEKELNHLNNIISCEYSNKGEFPKHYFVIWDKDNMQKLLERFQVRIPEEITSLSHIEYTETEKFDKILLGIKNMDEQRSFIDKMPEDGIKELILSICKKYQLMTGSCGIYDDMKTKAIYFVNEKEQLYFTTNDTIATLKDSIFKTGIQI